MYEFEVNNATVAAETPQEIIKIFSRGLNDVHSLAILPWEEHCTECAMPMCYSSCNLYSARKDGKCRRFTDGIVPIKGVSNLQGYGTKIIFKRWGQLMAYGNIKPVATNIFKYVEKSIYAIDSIIGRIPDSKVNLFGRSGISSRVQRRLKQSLAASGVFSNANKNTLPDYLLLEIFNPNVATVNLTLTIKSRNDEDYSVGYQQLLELQTGFNEFRINTSDICGRIDLRCNFSISLNPNILDESQEGLTLYFGMLNFVWNSQPQSIAKVPDTKLKTNHVKVVVWDLDNTIWDGVLLEHGVENVKLKPGILDIIKELDRRGILNSVASKNDYDDALEALKHFNLDSYILFPQVSWDQKGLAVRKIISSFNVGENTIAFIDDQPFERDEVSSLNPLVRTFDAIEYKNILSLPEFNPPLSIDSHLRREYYTLDIQRQEALSTFSGDYREFLKECNIVLKIYTPQENNIERIMELVLRTNQLNFSGNKYSKQEILSLINADTHDLYCLDCQDKYGQYGTVGFAIVDKSQYTLIDLMFSCRVQSKRVEHAFISFLLKHYQSRECKVFNALYVKTARNAKAGAVFHDMKFSENSIAANNNTTLIYSFDYSLEVLDDDIITIQWNDLAWEK